jgi:transposase
MLLMRMFVGLDWASAEHAVCVLDERGKVRAQLAAPHSAAGLARLIAQLCRFGEPAALPIAIERPSGLLVDTLVEAGFPVYPVHPNVVKACRARYRAASSKSDPYDAYVLADLLRTDGHRLRALQPQRDATRALRALVRGRDDLVATRVALANQLRALLESFWPGAAALFADIDSPIALAFLTRYPTPQSAARLGPKRLAAFLAQYSYSGRRTADELLARLHDAPIGRAGAAEAAAKGEIVRALVAALTALRSELQRLSAAVEHAVATHGDGPLVMSLPRAGHINAAQILAELGDDRGRFTCDAHLAAEAGVAPVTYRSGKQHGVAFRRACNQRFRQAVICFADNSRRGSPWAAAVYARARARGCNHPHAVRILARAWLRVLWRCWRDRAPYDPTKHRAAKHMLDAA